MPDKKLDHQMSQEDREKVRDDYVASQKPVEREPPAELVYEAEPGRKTAAKAPRKDTKKGK